MAIFHFFSLAPEQLAENAGNTSHAIPIPSLIKSETESEAFYLNSFKEATGTFPAGPLP